MLILCSTLIMRPESNGDSALPSICCIVESILSSTNDVGEPIRRPTLPSVRFKIRSTYEFLLTFQSKYSVIKKSSIFLPRTSNVLPRQSGSWLALARKSVQPDIELLRSFTSKRYHGQDVMISCRGR